MHIETINHFCLGRLGKLNFENKKLLSPCYLSFLDHLPFPNQIYITERKKQKNAIINYGSAFRKFEIDEFGILPDYNFGFNAPTTLIKEAMKKNIEIAESYPEYGTTARGGNSLALWNEYADNLKERRLVRIGGAHRLISRPRLFVEVLSYMREKLNPNSILYIPGAKPWHIPLMSFLGIDLFDNLYAYIAASKREYLTLREAMPLNKMRELPCSCKVCSDKTPEDMTIEELLRHNQSIINLSLIEIRESMRSGSFFNLLEERSVSSQEASSALRIAYIEKQEILDRYLPVY